jgi:TonB family protein
MKLKHVALGVVAASLLPAASADEPGKAKPFTISLASSVDPVDHPDLRYPAYAGLRDLEGSCEVTFAVNESGKADGIRVGACTSAPFRRAAKSAVEAMTFAPRAAAQEPARMRIDWALSESAVRTASLD